MHSLTPPEDIKPPIQSQTRALSLDCEVDFSELDEDAGHRPRRHYPLQLTASTCGRYISAFKNRNIFVFSLGDICATPRSPHVGPQAIKMIPCPQRVLAVAMNTSSSSCSLVALLKGRLGLTCNLTEQHDRRPSFVMPKVRIPNWTFSTNRQPGFLDDEVEVELPLPLSSLVTENGSNASNSWAHEELPFTISPEQYSYDNSPSLPAQFILHQDLCSANDPPISLAIWPQRHCIAFGNSTGIELRWVDAVSGENMIRLFDSSRVNHHLYFLPSRADDEPNKVRLVSSPAPPYQQFALLQKLRPDQEQEVENEMMWKSMSELSFRDDVRERTKPTYYNVKPCGDGWHVLFIDGETGNVCLGKDDQHGETVEDRISKKVIFLNPKTAETDTEIAKPTCYAAATEGEWGPRVVVGYRNGDVYLFAVPSHICRAGRGGKQWEWLQDWQAHEEVNGGGSGLAVWPIELRGVKIGHVDGLADVAIQVEGDGVRIWAFSSHSKGFSWSSSTRNQGQGKKYRVLDDELGLRVEDEMDEDGDWHMRDAPPLQQFSAFDGCVSDTTVPNPLTLPRKELSEVTPHDVDEDEGYFSAEDNHSTPPPNVETSPHSQKRVHDTPLHRSDVSMKDVSNDSFKSGIPYLTIGIPGSQYNPNKRRRLNNTLSHSRTAERDMIDTKSSFDPDQKTIEWVGSAFAISIPSREGRWSGSEVEAEDWIPDYLGMGEGWDGQCETGDRGLDLWDLARWGWGVDIL